MSNILRISLASLFALSLNSAHGAYSGTSPQSSPTNPGSYNQVQDSSIQSPYGSQNPSLNQNPASNPSYNQDQGNNQTYFNQNNRSTSNPNSSYYQQTNPSQYNSTIPQTNANPYNSNPNSTNQPQTYNSRWNQSSNYNQIADADDDNTNTDAEKKYPQDRASTDADRQLNAKIRDKISGWFTDSYKNISINTANGVVTINGFVSSQDDLTKLQKEIRKIDGVRSVNNNAQVRQ